MFPIYFPLPISPCLISRLFFLFLGQSQPIFPLCCLFFFVLLLVELFKIRRDDWYRETHHQNTRYGTERPNKLS